MANQRTELLGNLVAAQFDLERAIAEMMQSGAGTGAAQSQLVRIGQLMRAIGSADAPTLVAMQASVAGLVGEAQAIAQQGRDSASRVDNGDTLAAVDARTRATVQRISDDLFERKIFDPYLRFDNAEEEEAYRKRETERQEFIRRELAKGTPEGSRNAADAAVDQIKDAGRHGADQSPDYQRLLNEATATRDQQDAAIARSTIQRGDPKEKATELAVTPSAELDEIAAIFKAAGVQSPSAQLADAKGHGLTDATIERSNDSARQV